MLTSSHRARIAVAFTILISSILTIGFGAVPASATQVSVSGHVTVDGSPIENETIQISSSGSASYLATTVTTEGGYYDFVDIPDGTYTVTAPDTDDRYKYDRGSSQTIQFAGSMIVKNIALNTWSVGTNTITGKVTDSVTGDAVETASVRFSGDADTRSQSARVGSDGGYTFSGLSAGRFQLTASAVDYVAQSVQVAVENDAAAQNFMLVKADSTIDGVVTLTDTGPVAGAFVQVFAPGTTRPGLGNATTDSVGHFVIPRLGAGSYTVTTGGPGAPYSAVSVDVTAVAGETTTANLTVTARNTFAISGTISDASLSPLAKICVTASDSSGAFSGGNGMRGTGSDGTYTVEGLTAGSYDLLFWDCDYRRVPAYATTFYGGSRSLAHATHIVIANRDWGRVNIQLAVGGSISGHVNVQTPDGMTELPSSRFAAAVIYQLVDGVWEVAPQLSPLVGRGEGKYDAFGLQAGTYRVGWSDNFSGPRAYAPRFWSGAADVASATDVVVTAGVDTAHIDGTLFIPRPGFDPTAVETAALAPADKGMIAADSNATQGEDLKVDVGAAYAGEWVSVWGHSTPTLMGGWTQVSSAGIATVVVPSSLPSGSHTLVAQTATGGVIGWSPITIGAAAGGPATTGTLAATGGSLPLLATLIGAISALLGIALLLVRRRLNLQR